jgi:SprT protein
MPQNILIKYIPLQAEPVIMSWLNQLSINLIIKRERLTKLGDYRHPRNNLPARISINGNLNKFSFLITLVHEISHAAVYKSVGYNILPHGKEWKNEFKTKMHFLMEMEIFPADIKTVLEKYIKNPKASSGADQNLVLVLMKYDELIENNNRTMLLNSLKIGDTFILPNGLRLKKIEKRRTRILCEDVKSKKKYLVSSVATVSLTI